ncbi:MAG: OmpA family protein [Bacteroidetes bacterium]|nr:OmpA family protein [Bacteroidota bacterium]MDF1864221.1 OmpA family protein [Saprospiraceae bacterium]
MRTTTLLLILLFAAEITLGQSSKLKRGRDHMANLDYISAIELYNSVLDKNDVAEAIINLAEAYRKINDTENAEVWYRRAMELPEVQPVHKLYYGMMLMRNGKCGLARDWFQQYVDAAPDDLRGQYLLRACDYEEELMQKNAGIFEVIHTDFNSDLDDFGPAYYKNGLVFASDRDKNPIVDRKHNWTGNPFLELYYVDVRQTGSESEEDPCGDFIFGRPEKFSNEINSKFHDATVAFSKDGDEIYFTRNNFINGKKEEDDEGIIKLKIFYAKTAGEGQWQDLEDLPINSNEYNVAHPALSADGKKLFFASDMPGGFGGMDIYLSEREGGKWGPPINLGPEVNTEGHEIFPYVALDNRVYFASDGLIGLGGLDIYFVEEKEEGIYSSPENLGFPINTIADDFGILFDDAGTCGYLSSDRAGGAGGDDLYTFKKTAVPVEIFVFDEKTGLPIEGASVFLNCQEESYITNDMGKVIFDMKLNKCCDFTAAMEGYDENQKEGCTKDISLSDRLIVEIPLTPQANFELEGIVFDDGSGLPMEEAVVELTNDCDDTVAELITDESGRYYFKLEKDCCYKVKARKEGYLAAWKEDICTKDMTSDESIKANLHLQPTILNITDGTEEPPVTILENEYTVYNPATEMWYDKETGEIADKEYPDGKTYEKGGLTDIWVPSDGHKDDLKKGAGTDENVTTVIVPYLLHIYYDFNEAYLREDAMPELEKLEKTLSENEDYIIEIGSHTDARGSNHYNMRLSQRRAEAVVKWLVERGVDRDRLVPRGYGETVTVNDCVNNVRCAEGEHQLNRRTEFKVIGCITCIDPAAKKISKERKEVPVNKGCTTCPF